MTTNFQFSVSRFILASLTALALQQSYGAVSLENSDRLVAEKITQTTIFSEPLKPIRGAIPSHAESEELWKVVAGIRDRVNTSPVESLEAFLATHPASPWEPSIRLNLGTCYERRGRYNTAMNHWRAVWDATKNSSIPEERHLADSAFGQLTRVLLGFGQVSELKTLLEEAQGRYVASPSLRVTIGTTRSEYVKTIHGTDVGFRCGSMALSAVAKALGARHENVIRIGRIPSPVTGFSLQRLVNIAQAEGVDVTPIKARPGSEIVVPSVVHLQGNHFAAIVERRHGFFKVVDPALGKPKWMTLQDIEAEASGYYLLPKGKANALQMDVLSEEESAKVFGKGYVSSVNDSDDGCSNGSGGTGSGGDGSGSSGSDSGSAGISVGGSAPGCKGCGGGNGDSSSGGDPSCPTCPDGTTPEGPMGPNGPGSQQGPGGGGGDYFSSAPASGMPVWKVSEPYINLWLYDEPMAYTTGLGQRIAFRLAYKQRGNRQTSSAIFNFGEMWHCSWLGYIADDAPGASATMVNIGGGERTYYPDGTTKELYSSTTMERTEQNGVLTGFIVRHANGSRDEYGFVRSIDSADHAFLTARYNPFGQVTRFVYDSTRSDAAKLLYIVDTDGRTNTLNYANGNLQVTSVQDPFGNSAVLTYDQNGFLTNLVDVCGLGSGFQYDEHGWITNMVTPYGATRFEHSINTTANYEFGAPYDHYPDFNNWSVPVRAIRIVDPESRTNVFMLKQNCSAIWTNYMQFPQDDYAEPFLGEFPDWATYPFGQNESVMFDSAFDVGGWFFYRNSFHWGPTQAASLPGDLTTLSVANFEQARMRHWLHEQAWVLGQFLSIERAPSPDGENPGQTTWYAYRFGSSNPPFAPVEAKPSIVARKLPDGTAAYTWFDRDDWGRPTNVVSTYSLTSGQTPFTRTNSYIYAANGIDLLYQTDVGGHTNASYVYDSSHRLLRITNATGGVIFYTYDNKGRLTSAKSAAGLTTTNIYFASGPYTNWVSKTIDLEIGRTNSYTYTNNHVWTHTDPYGLTVTNTWDALNRLVRVDYPDGTSSRNVYDRLDLVRTYDRMGYTNSFAYDNARRLIAETNALGSFKLYQYCACGGVDNVHDAEGNDTAYVYDKAGRLVQTILPGAAPLTYTRNFLGQITSVVDTSGLAVTNWYNNQGLLYASSNMFGCTKLVLYDNEDHATNTLDANGIRMSMTYDVAGRLLTRTYPDSGVERFGYSQRGLVAYTNQIGMPTFYAYNEAGQKTAETNANSEVTLFRYDPSGNLTNLVDGNLHNTYWKYNQYGQVTNKLDHLGNSMFRYAYNANGWLISRITPAKGETAYTYDAGGNLKTVNYPSSHDIALQYDIMGRLTNMVDAAGTTSFAFDALGLMRMEDGPWDSDTVRYTYANKLREALELEQPGSSPWVQEYDHDSSRRLTAIVSPAGQFGYDYSRSGQASPGTLISRLTIPTGGWITNEFDANGRLLKTSLKNSHNVLTNSHAYTYNQANQRTQQVFTAGNYTAYTYDKIGQLTRSLGREPGGSPIRSHERYGYTYDAAGNLIFRTNYIVTTRNFYVNSLNQLTNIVRPTTSLVVAGSTTGNPTNLFVWGSGLSTVFVNPYKDGTWSAPNAMPFDGMNTYTAVAQDAYGRTDTNSVSVYSPTSMEITYDANGNMTSDGRRFFEYDDENQLVRVTVTNATRSDFVYDGKMRRRARIECAWNAGTWVTNEIVRYVYDGNLVIQERHFDASYPDLKPQLVTYTRGLDLSGSLQSAGGIGGLLARSESQPSATPGAELSSAYYHCDGNGNIIAMVDQKDIMVAKYFYDAFGNLISATGPLAEANLYRFSSKEFHVNSGLVYYLCRYYDPGFQRWINRDPLGDAASLSFSFLQSRLGAAFAVAEIVEGPDLYRFVAGSPVSFEDPWGLACGSGSTEYIVPDSPIFDFGEACENHDNCYGTCGASKRDCDKQFLKDMKAAVRKAGPMSPALGDLLAYTYYSAVVTMGEGAFKAAQKEACMQMCIENGAGNMNGDIGVIFR